jgi:hypothetical protein
MDRNLMKHRQALYPVLDRRRLQESVDTDTFFARHKDVSGVNCAQVFYGITSHFVNVFGMLTKSEGPTALEDFVRKEGIPSVLRSDNSRMQRWGTKVLKHLRGWMIAAEYTEPYHPQQDPEELRAIRWLKQSTRVMQKRTGSPRS